jgi:SpoVK/Ycf46/Vps4 family AAA+-type ATPase
MNKIIKSISLTLLLASGASNMRLYAIDPVDTTKKLFDVDDISNKTQDEIDQIVQDDIDDFDNKTQDEIDSINDYKAEMDRLSAQITAQYEAAKNKRENEYSKGKNDEIVEAGVEAMKTTRNYAWSFGKAAVEGAALGLATEGLKSKMKEYWDDYRREKAVPLTKKDFAYVPQSVSALIEYVKKAALFNKGKVSKKLKASILMEGAAGTGKTHNAQLVASELGAEFFSVSATDMQDKYMGETARKIRTLFARARKSKKTAVVFIDEIHVCGSSGAGADDDHKHVADMHNALLTELDGGKGQDNSNIVFIGATNHGETIEEALRQRMPKKVMIERPTETERAALLKFYFNKTEHVLTDQDFTFFAGFWSTGGWNARSFPSLIEQSKEMAVEQGKVAIDRACVLKALPKVQQSFTEDILSKKNSKILKTIAKGTGDIIEGAKTGKQIGFLGGAMSVLVALLGRS